MRVWIFYILNNKLQCNEIEFSVSRSFISSSLVIVLQSTLKPFFLFCCYLLSLAPCTLHRYIYYILLHFLFQLLFYYSNISLLISVFLETYSCASTYFPLYVLPVNFS